MTHRARPNRRRQFLAAAAAAASLPLARLATAQSNASKPIKLVVGYAPGGAADTLARAMAAKAQEHLGAPMLVENRLGAGGFIAAEEVARSPADGHTLLLSDDAQLAIAPGIGEPRAAALSGMLVPVIGLTALPIVLVVNNSLPATSLTELIALARKRPGSLSYASAGNGNISHMSAELFKNLSRTFLTHIPYRGGAPGLASVLAGDTQLMFLSVPTAMAHIRSGKLRALAVASFQRCPALPDVPTAFEAGLAGMVAVSWHGVMAPSATPPLLLRRIHAGLSAAARAVDTLERLRRLGFEMNLRDSAEFPRWIDSETDKWRRLAKVANIKPEA